MKKFSYTYKIKSLDVETCSGMVQYIPDDINLSPIEFIMSFRLIDYKMFLDDNGELIYNSQEEVPYQTNVEKHISTNAPHEMWASQEAMMANMEFLRSKIPS